MRPNVPPRDPHAKAPSRAPRERDKSASEIARGHDCMRAREARHIVVGRVDERLEFPTKL